MLALSALIAVLAQSEPPAQDLPVITVVARRAQPLAAAPVSASALAPDAAAPGVAHANELLDAVPGTWVSRGSGQEHLTAIRSPVLTGAGACGAFLYLEDGIPIRPAGFCNVNNLFELNFEQADRVEVLRGPGSALHGSNALHGAINVIPPAVAAVPERAVTLWFGEEDYRRADLSLSTRNAGHGLRLDASLVGAGSFRDREEYDQQKLNARWETERGAIAVTTTLAATNLNQETAGFIFGRDAYRDPALRTANVNPEAFRDARALRLASRWQSSGGVWEWELTPFARASRMDFLQHFLPGQPLEENGQDSAGLQWLAQRADGAWSWGVDVEWADGFLRETQAAPITSGSPFLQETRPAGRHYDFRVGSLLLAAYGHREWTLGSNWRLDAGLRAERLAYDYDNRMADGNARDDGTACGFGGCLFNRPADREDRFVELAPKLALSRDLAAGATAYVRLARGFRAPQTNELYRLQRGQQVTDLEPELLDTFELGYRRAGEGWTLALSAYAMRKRNFIFRDADGFNVSDGRTRHHGLEWEWTFEPAPGWRVDAAGSYARHEYAFDRDAGGGERIVAGNDVDTAPRWLGRAALQAPAAGGRIRLEWVHQGGYFLDAANEHRYGGHDLLNLDWRRSRGRWEFGARLDNLTGRRYAERADFAFGRYRYFPGAGRTLKLGLTHRWQ